MIPETSSAGTISSESSHMEWLSGRMFSAETKNRSESVIDVLRTALLDGRFQAGERLLEQELSRVLNVSRTPVRAALQKLSGEGLLDHEPRRGYTARGVSVSELVNAYDMRALAEGLAARLAAERGLDPDAMRRMEAILTKGDVGLREGVMEGPARKLYAEVNSAFHEIILQASHSRFVADVVRLCHRFPQVSAANIFQNVFQFNLAEARERHKDHHRIYEAIISREAKEAEAIMRAHVTSRKMSIVRAFARAGASQPSG